MGRRKKARTRPGLPPTLTLCWFCVNAVPSEEGGAGCSWSRSGEPVKGWEAVRRDVLIPRGARKNVLSESYRVRACPMFEEG